MTAKGCQIRFMSNKRKKLFCEHEDDLARTSLLRPTKSASSVFLARLCEGRVPSSKSSRGRLQCSGTIMKSQKGRKTQPRQMKARQTVKETWCSRLRT